MDGQDGVGWLVGGSLQYRFGRLSPFGPASPHACPCDLAALARVRFAMVFRGRWLMGVGVYHAMNLRNPLVAGVVRFADRCYVAFASFLCARSFDHSHSALSD